MISILFIKDCPSNEELQDNSLILYKYRKAQYLGDYIENCFMASAANHTFIKAVQKEVLEQFDSEPYCISKRAEFPKDLIEQLLDEQPLFSEEHSKNLYCATQITTEPLTQLYDNHHIEALISHVFINYCISEPCFGHDSIYAGADTPIQSHASYNDIYR